MKKLGLLPLGRPTFDVPYAEEQLAGMLSHLEAMDFELLGERSLLFDSESTLAAIDSLKKQQPDIVVLLQVTFTDASMAVVAAENFDVPMLVWAVPEPRLGGRLRLNAFCGLNLASHALGLMQRDFGYLYLSPESGDCEKELSAALMGNSIGHGGALSGERVPVSEVESDAAAAGQAKQVLAQLKGRKVACLGEHPEGFATCAYDPKKALQLTGVSIDNLPLNRLFETANGVSQEAADAVFKDVDESLAGVAELDQQQLDKSLKLKVALDELAGEKSYDAFAIRCWPETFTEYGGAGCGAVSMLGEARKPCACEADVYGAITQLLLQAVADAPVFLVDLVDIDAADNSAVVWHCGQAPLSMADPASSPSATIHTNRRMPLLYEFPLKPGRVTFARLSQARGTTQLILSRGDVLQRDMAFTGTSGVVRFDTDASELLPKVIRSGLEHHMGLVYGEHTDLLRQTAAALDIAVLEI